MDPIDYYLNPGSVLNNSDERFAQHKKHGLNCLTVLRGYHAIQ